MPPSSSSSSTTTTTTPILSFTQSLLFKWIRLVTIVVFVPLTVTYYHLCCYLRQEGAIAKRFYRSSPPSPSITNREQQQQQQQHKDGLYFHHHSNGEYMHPTNDLFAPSIVQLVTRLGQPKERVVLLPSSIESKDKDETNQYHYGSSSSSQSQSQPIKIVDYSDPFLSFDSIVLSTTFSFSSTSPSTVESSKIQNKKQTAITTDGIQDETTSSSMNQYGFRTNPNKRYNTAPNQSSSSSSYRLLPVATYFWIGMNVVLFLLYKLYTVDPSLVALNSHIYVDYGRAITGNLAHFDVWHVGMNMMSAYTLGPLLEVAGPTAFTNLQFPELQQSRYGTTSTIPLFLYTSSFLVLNTLVVVGLHQIRARYSSSSSSSPNNNSNNNNNILVPFPNMVGFSGILFAWSVVATVQTQQPTCPIFFLPDLCFDTYPLFGGSDSRFTISLGPFLQLLLLQVLLPRASFVGHFAGIVVGFLWHWKILPPLEYIQPCIVYPFVWVIGKWWYHHRPAYDTPYYHNSNNNSSNTNNISSTVGGLWSSSGMIGGATTTTTTLAWSNFQSSTLYPLLRSIRTILLLHLLLLVTVIVVNRPNHHDPPHPHLSTITVTIATGTILLTNSMVLSEILLIGILHWLIRWVVIGTASEVDNNSNHNHSQNYNNYSHSKRMVGIIGRGLIVMVLVVTITDSMTLGGWGATRILWTGRGGGAMWTLLLILWSIRLLLWAILLCLVCETLGVANEFVVGGNSHNSNDDIWYQLLGWSIVDACRPVGKALGNYKSYGGTGGGSSLGVLLLQRNHLGLPPSGRTSSRNPSVLLLSTPTTTPTPTMTATSSSLVSRFETRGGSSRESKSLLSSTTTTTTIIDGNMTRTEKELASTSSSSRVISDLV
jgi:membrane associated rhomboid family serine protease